MPYHNWSDKEFDFKGISDAAEFIGNTLRKYYRVSVRQHKEKYGQVRVYLSLGWSSIHDITHAGYYHTQYTKDGFWYNLNYNTTFNSIVFGALNLVMIPFHKVVYRWIYKRAVRRWPHLTAEILCSADYPELLTGLGYEHNLKAGQWREF